MRWSSACTRGSWTFGTLTAVAVVPLFISRTRRPATDSAMLRYASGVEPPICGIRITFGRPCNGRGHGESALGQDGAGDVWVVDESDDAASASTVVALEDVGAEGWAIKSAQSIRWRGVMRALGRLWPRAEARRGGAMRTILERSFAFGASAPW